MADSLTPATGAVAGEDEQILLRVARGGIHIEERELSYQLERRTTIPSPTRTSCSTCWPR
jgi:hypothetical protein